MVQNLMRYEPPGTYFARFKVGGKPIWKSLETTVCSLAKRRLPDKIREPPALDTSRRKKMAEIEARLSYVDDKTLLYLAEVLKVPVHDLFPPRTPGKRIHDFIEKLETIRF